jgi:hypothetical protein|tara:strand:- start:41529 stop:42440 length:912 start_codon:yes stop_codon:yes gene_type:complete
MSFANLKRSRGNFDKLTKELEKVQAPTQQNNSSGDDRFWKPELDKSGNGYAVIRFLPAVEGEELPWARVWSHAFQGPGGWYIENSLTTLGQKDPVSEENTKLWNTGSDADKEIARKRKRKLSYFTNILVVSDPKHPEHEGKVFLYKFGKKIFDKLTEAMKPEFEDEKAINPFDFWEGANFKLKIRKVDGYWNYDKSEFETISKLKENDEDIEAIWKMQKPLVEFSAPSNFKSYDELKAKFEKTVYGTGKTETADQIDIPPVSAAVEEVSEQVKETVPSAPIATPPSNDDEDDTMNYFSKLVND